MRSFARRENIKLRWEDILAYVDNAVNAIWVFRCVCILLLIKIDGDVPLEERR